ncbi:hypothetical protein M569_08196 [Genlisea aurea]|uniref:Uncharacterized protein n=1 Tax=Genlisea aurea TaxID=192259 RepID=S8CP29_9LAMI|nr:hypothetical protein M569_08196 [Genlisea aurea]
MEDLIDHDKDKLKLDEDDGQQISEDTEKPKSVLPADGVKESSVGDEHVEDLQSKMVPTIETTNVSSKSQGCIDASSSDTSTTDQLSTLIELSELCRFEDVSHEVEEANMRSRKFSGEDNITNSEPTVANSDESCEEGNLSVIEQQSTFSEYHGWISYSSETGCLQGHELPMLGHVISDEAPSSSLPQKTSADAMDQVDVCDLNEDFGSFGGSRHNEELHGHGAQTSSFPPRHGKKFGFDSAMHYSKMETIELSPASIMKPPPDATAMVHGTAHFSHHGRKGFSYFKKLIKDRLTSRSRLSMEYQLLHIYHGEESSNNVDTTTVVPLEMTETDWELV